MLEGSSYVGRTTLRMGSSNSCSSFAVYVNDAYLLVRQSYSLSNLTTKRSHLEVKPHNMAIMLVIGDPAIGHFNCVAG